MAKSKENRPAKVQAKLVYVELINRRFHERLEWLPADIRVNSIVQCDDDTRYWTVKEIYKQAV